MNTKVDHDLCIGCGVCADNCPDVFEIRGDRLAHVKDGADSEAAGCCQQAADLCPTEAISL